MTVSANSTLDFNRDQIITMAYRLTGTLASGQTPSAGDISMASDFMNLELAMLQAEGVVLRTVERTTLTLVDGTAAYSLPAGTIDVQLGPNDQAGMIVDSDSNESVVVAMSRSEYMDITDKSVTVTARPTMVYIEKLATVSATFWPVPDSTAITFRYSRVRLLSDMDTGAVTVDLARRWLQAIAFAVASQIALAKSMPTQNVTFLRGEAERLKVILRADDRERVKTRFSIGHRGRNW